ncbi:MAG: DUF928 domain-containing protein [Coleofasciculus sp. C1-SOL-03]|uniref:DUF928 domain-containing protein n=1 Tax=Coleofasciculus sp. C1-SOL-03 TaxID=3069522 RepID=UPI0032F3DD26
MISDLESYTEFIVMQNAIANPMICPKHLIAACLTSWISLVSLSSSQPAQAEPSLARRFPIKTPIEDLVKCGYTKEQITLKIPDKRVLNQLDITPGNRMENYAATRCQGYRPPIPLMALIPQSTVGRTLADYPTLYFYIPDVSLQNVRAEFSFYDHQLKTIIYEQEIPLKTSDSIVAVDLANAPDLPPLEEDKPYFWYFSIIFDPYDRSDSTYVAGWIQRITPTSQIDQELDRATPEAKPAIYANHGIWYETLESLVQLRCSQPENSTLTSNWQSLLQQVGLSNLARKPLAQCPSARIANQFWQSTE